VFNYRKRQQRFDQELFVLVAQVDAIREEHPGCGVEKMYYTLQPEYLGRDKFCEIFMGLGYGVKKVRNYQKTTIPCHLDYPNLIEGMTVSRPYQVIQSDITYFELNGRFYYLVFIVDVYTKEILSFTVSSHMKAEANLRALRQALRKITFLPGELIHHSDRGAQYGSNIYRKTLENNGIQISMGLKAQDNAYVERVNGTIKNEYLKRWDIDNEKKLRIKTKAAVKHYNDKRKHMAFNNQYSPLEFKKTLVDLNTQKRPKVIIYAEGNYKIKEALSHLDFNPEKEPQAHNCPIVI
jgi:hypothetical protein